MVQDELWIDGDTLIYEVRHQGTYTEKDTKLIVPVVNTEWDKLMVRIESGDIQFMTNHPTPPEFDLQTKNGDVIEIGY